MSGERGRARAVDRSRTPSTASASRPILDLSSPTKRCGKSSTVIVARHLCRAPLLSGNITPAALFRAVQAWKPTLLIDEADTFAKMHDELRGILNAGHTRDTAFVVRAEGDSQRAAAVLDLGAEARRGDRTAAGHDRGSLDPDCPDAQADERQEAGRLRPRGRARATASPSGASSPASCSTTSTRSRPPTSSARTASTTAPGTTGGRCSRSRQLPAATGPTVRRSRLALAATRRRRRRGRRDARPPARLGGRSARRAPRRRRTSSPSRLEGRRAVGEVVGGAGRARTSSRARRLVWRGC